MDEPINPKQLAAEVIMRAKASKVFEVSFTVPANWLPQGLIPFDMEITKGPTPTSKSLCLVRVVALNEEEAKTKVEDFIREQKS